MEDSHLDILEASIHGDQAADLIDCWVVDDLICDMKRCSWVLLPGLVGHLHCSLHSPAVPISLCQLDLDILQRAAYTQQISMLLDSQVLISAWAL